MERLTDSKVAAELKSNYEGLQKVGIAPSPDHLQYVKLAKFEDALEKVEEMTKKMEQLIPESKDDEESCHVEADNLLCDALELFGCKEIGTHFWKLKKWYA